MANNRNNSKNKRRVILHTMIYLSSKSAIIFNLRFKKYMKDIWDLITILVSNWMRCADFNHFRTSKAKQHRQTKFKLSNPSTSKTQLVLIKCKRFNEKTLKIGMKSVSEAGEGPRTSSKIPLKSHLRQKWNCLGSSYYRYKTCSTLLWEELPYAIPIFGTE